MHIDLAETTSPATDSSVEHDQNGFQRAHMDRRITLKLDLFITPLVTMVYLLSFLDRTNIGNARVVSTLTRTSGSVLTMNQQAGLQKDLRLTDLQYQTGMCCNLPVTSALTYLKLSRSPSFRISRQKFQQT